MDRTDGTNRVQVITHRTRYVIVALLAALPLCWGLGDRSLWQDEAFTAELSERMMIYGRPLSWDGRNLLTMDIAEKLPPAEARRLSADADAAIRYFEVRGDFKADTTWIGHPWGQFIVTASSFAIFGKGTWQARLPFALMGIAAAVLTYAIARRRFANPLVAPVSVALLLTNVYWILHMRQCRYYAASSLLMLVTIAAWLRWRDRRRLGATGFIAAAWLWFQFDYGSFWPVIGILMAEALRCSWRKPREVLTVGIVLGMGVAPFVWLYELVSRLKFASIPWYERFFGTLVLVDHYVLPILVLVPGVLFLTLRRRSRPLEARLLGVIAAICAGFLIWLPLSTPFPFHRYAVVLTPLGCLFSAWLVSELAQIAGTGWRRAGVATVLTAGLSMTLLASLPTTLALPGLHHWVAGDSSWLRREHGLYAAELTGRLPDPNRRIIEYLQARLEPSDEVLINYEDVPVMFYTEARVRGGISQFRVNAKDGTAPRFAVIRNSARFAQPDFIRRAMRSEKWTEVHVDAPDVPWSNIPEPAYRHLLLSTDRARISIFERQDGGAMSGDDLPQTE